MGPGTEAGPPAKSSITLSMFQPSVDLRLALSITCGTYFTIEMASFTNDSAYR